MRTVCWLVTLTSICAAESPAPDAMPLSELKAYVDRLGKRVAELADADDLLDTLHFGWFDRPYARTTLAILVKTTDTLRRELRMRDLGNGAIPDSTIREMLVWAEEAHTRVLASGTDEGFRPHRLSVTVEGLTTDSTTLPLYGFVDRTTATRHDPRFGDLDLMAALGFRVYPLSDRDPLLAQSDEVLFERANALGMAVVTLGARESGATSSKSVNARTVSEATFAVRPVTLYDLIGIGAGSPRSAGPALAITDFVFGESPAAFIARRALARGVNGGAGYIVDGWQLPRFRTSNADDRCEATTAAMWVSATQGQSLGLLRGWRDLRDGSGSPYASVLLRPSQIETIAHTALDLIRLRQHLSCFDAAPPLAVAVGPDAIDARDGNRWADWIEPLWAMLLERQIRFDVVSLRSDQGRLRERYDVVFPVRRRDVADLTLAMTRLERALATVGEHVERVTVRNLDGTLAGDVFVRDARTENGSRCVVVVNLSQEPRLLKLQAGSPLGKLRDVTSDTVVKPGGRFDVAPYQVRLLWPDG